MKQTSFILLLFILSSCFTDDNHKKAIIENMIHEVSYLSSDSLEGRETGTAGERLAAEFIVSKFLEYNITPMGTDGFYQKFDAVIKENPHSNTTKKEITGTNVVGYLDNQADEIVILGAHYDHVGYGDFGSLYDGEREVHNGADDNASGVSLLINLAKELSEVKEYNYLFIAFSGEELGLFGSSYYAKNPTISFDSVRYMINFDMVGRLNNDNKLAINGVGTSREWMPLINDNNTYGFDIKTSESGIGPSDQTAFYLQDLPVLHFFTGQHSDYHKPSDDVDKINFDGMFTLFSYVSDIIDASTEIEDFNFQETTSDSSTTPRFNVTLGVMPDYMFDGKGMRIDGVSKNKTASKYGILKGDIVIGIGDLKVTDMMSYMKALGEFNKGEATTVRVLREEKEIDIEIVFL